MKQDKLYEVIDNFLEVIMHARATLILENPSKTEEIDRFIADKSKEYMHLFENKTRKELLQYALLNI